MALIGGEGAGPSGRGVRRGYHGAARRGVGARADQTRGSYYPDGVLMVFR
jgi:hypothetical protein